MPGNCKIPFEKQECVDRFLAKSKNPYIEFCLFEKTRDIPVLNKMNYKVSISIFVIVNKMHLVNSVFNRGAGPDLIRE